MGSSKFSELGSTIHKTPNEPKVTKRKKKFGISLTDQELKRIFDMLHDDSSPAETDITTSEGTRMANQVAQKLAEMNLGTTPNNTLAAEMDTTMTDASAQEAPNPPKPAKFKPRAVRTSEQARAKRAEQEEKKVKMSAPEAKKWEETDQEASCITQSPAQTEITMTDVTANNDVTVTGADVDGTSATNHNSSAPVSDPHCKTKSAQRMPFILKDCLPKIGMVYLDFGYGKAQRHLLSQRWWMDAEVVWALWSQQATKDKMVLQALISPVFDQAAWQLRAKGMNYAQEGPVQGGHVPEDDYSYQERRDKETKKMWDTFLRELWDQFRTGSWVCELNKQHFVRLFSVLADARFRAYYYPKGDNREHPELVCAITRFLTAANEAGTPWTISEVEDEDEEDEGGY